MASFIDEITLHIRAGHGGNGVVRWRHEKGRDKAGAAGGNGGRGGDVYVRAIRNLNILANYRHVKEFAAKDGVHGMKLSMDGKNGEDLTLDLPIGSTIKNLTTGKVFSLLEDGQTVKILSGGRGGLGNEHFKASTNVRPRESTPGKPGEESDFYVELALVADAGLIGLPNAGKSSLLNALTNATSKVGSYPFTTINPHLGPLFGYVLADIPGLIAGASEGKGLGHKFLRHISRTKLILHCVSAENENVGDAYKTIRKELEAYVHEEDPTSSLYTVEAELPQTLVEKPEIVILTKTDMITPAELKKKKAELTKAVGTRGGRSKGSSKVLEVSVLSDQSVEELSRVIVSHLS